MYKLKSNRRGKGSTKKCSENQCEFENCGNENTDLVRCNNCDMWVCESCNDVNVSKLKTLTDKASTIYFLCKTCDSLIDNGPEQEKQLAREITILKRNETNQKNLLDEREKTIDELYEKINMFENKDPVDDHSVNKIIDEKFVSIKEEINKNLTDKLTKAFEKFNEKLTGIPEKIDQNYKSFADSVANLATKTKAPEAVAPSTNAKTPEVNDFRAIINEQRNMELNEANEKKARVANIIIHGVTESINTDKEEAKKHDVEYISEFLRVINVSATCKSIFRLGKPNAERKRPIKVITESENERDNIMSNLKRLKDVDAYRGISVTEDYTVNERNLIKNKAAEAKLNNDKEPADSLYIWKVRGTPKNGLTIKKFRKQQPQITVDTSLKDLM